MGRESPGLRHFQQMFIVYSLLIIVYSLLISVYSLLIIFYSLLIIVYSLLIIFYSLLILVHYLLIIFLFYIFLKFGDRMPLFLFIFHIFVTYIHSFNHIHTIHSSIAIRWGLSPISNLSNIFVYFWHIIHGNRGLGVEDRIGKQEVLSSIPPCAFFIFS
jgi:hypothetical protein